VVTKQKRTLKPKTKRTLRALEDRRVVIEGFGGKAPTFVAIVGGTTPPTGAWLQRGELQRFVEAAKRILK